MSQTPRGSPGPATILLAVFGGFGLLIGGYFVAIEVGRNWVGEFTAYPECCSRLAPPEPCKLLERKLGLAAIGFGEPALEARNLQKRCAQQRQDPPVAVAPQPGQAAPAAVATLLPSKDQPPAPPQQPAAAANDGDGGSETPCTEEVQSGMDLKVKLDDGTWKSFVGHEGGEDEPEVTYSLSSWDCKERYAVVEDGSPRSRLLDLKNGQTIDELEFWVWSPAHQFLVGGRGEQDAAGYAPPPAYAAIWSCAERSSTLGCKQLWSSQQIAVEALRGGLYSRSDATWKGEHSVSLRLSGGPPITCDCTATSCACTGADGLPLLMRGVGGPAEENVRRVMAGKREELRRCFEQAPPQMKAALAAGRLHLNAQVRTFGRIQGSNIEEPAVNHTPLGDCLEKVIEAADFGAFDLPDQPKGRGVSIRIPIDVPGAQGPAR